MRAAAAADPARAIAYQGAPGANSHRAATEWAPEALPLPCFSFADAIDAVKDGRAGCAMIPIDNSQAGRVADIHFLLPESGLSIVGEHFLHISHALMAIPGAKGPFQAAYSHPHALAPDHLHQQVIRQVVVPWRQRAPGAEPEKAVAVAGFMCERLATATWPDRATDVREGLPPPSGRTR